MHSCLSQSEYGPTSRLRLSLPQLKHRDVLVTTFSRFSLTLEYFFRLTVGTIVLIDGHLSVQVIVVGMSKSEEFPAMYVFSAESGSFLRTLGTVGDGPGCVAGCFGLRLNQTVWESTARGPYNRIPLCLLVQGDAVYVAE